MGKVSVSTFLGKASGDGLIRIYLLIALVFSIISALIVPPNQAPDEIAHFIRAYDISMGRFIPSSAPLEIPVVFERLLQKQRLYAIDNQRDLVSLRVNTDETVRYLSTSNYPFLIYLPQALGIVIGRILGLPAMGVFLFGRILNALVCVAALFGIVKIMPGKKWMLLLLFCSPMALYLFGSYSPDALTNVVALFFISLVFLYARMNRAFTKQDVAVLLFAGWLLALSKINIVPLALLFAIIPCQRFGSPRNKFLFLLGGLIIIGATLGIWNSMAPITPGGVREGVKPISQLLYVVLNPFYFIQTLANTFAKLWFYYLDGWFGVFSWLDASMPQLALLLYLIVLVFLAGLQDDSFVVSKQEKWVAALTWLISIALTFLILYMVWTEYQSDLVLGVQGRYLIPLMPLLLLIIPPFLNFLHGLERFKGLIAILTSILVWGIAVVVLILRFYVPCGLSYLRDVDCELPAEVWQDVAQLEPFVQGMSITQTFVADCDGMYRVDVYVSTHERVNNSTLLASVREVASQEFEKEYIVENQSIRDQNLVFFFDPIPNSKGEAYELQLETDANPENAISLMATQNDQYLAGQLWMNGVPQSGDLQFKYFCRVGVQSIR